MTEQLDAPIGSTSVAKWWVLTVVAGLVVSVALVLLLRGQFEPEPATVHAHDLPAGTETFDTLQRNHVPGTVAYDQIPPVGGDHAPIWATCGVYSTTVAPELAVHSMEHGTVWVVYDADRVVSDQLGQLERLVQASYQGLERYVLLSPYEGLPAPVVATAWGRQLLINDVGDERLRSFILDLAGSSDAPEPGLPCYNGGLGEPLDFAGPQENS